MKRRILDFVVLALSIFVLVSCGQKESMDGTYYEYYDVKGQLTIFKNYPVKVSGDTLVGQLHGDTYTINFDNHTLVRDGEILEYDFKEDILAFDDNTFVKVDSEKYKEMLKDGAKVE